MSNDIPLGLAVQKRREEIAKFISRHEEVSIAQLTAAFAAWSEMTIRRDLAQLAEQGKIILTRGGARILPSRFGLGEEVYSARESQSRSGKMAIADKAVQLVEPNKGIFIDSGTTAMAFAKLLPDVNMVVITSAPNIALDIAMRLSKPQVVLLGGTLSRHSISVTDPGVETQLSAFNIDTAFMGGSGFDERAGFSVGSQLDCRLKQAAISRSRRVVIMLDSSKFGVMLPYSYASLDDVDVVISDAEFPESIRKKYPKVEFK